MARATSASAPKPPAGRRRELRVRDAEATREAILEAAEQVFVARGFADAAVSEIASAAGVTKSLIHHHFGSKEGLWEAVKTRRFERYAAVQRRMLEESGPDPELLRHSMVVYFRFLAENPEFVRFICWMQLEQPGDHNHFGPAEQLTAAGVQRIRETQEVGGLRRDINPYSMLQAFLALGEHWFQTKGRRCQMHLPPDLAPGDDEQYLADVLKIFFEGVLPRTPQG
jgi:TetR/AcrR family transcriptional regulator